jgi:uncharacterized protein YidB (DUF937 family)
LGNQHSAGPGGFLNSGLGEMLERFHQAGHGPAAQSWVNLGPNQEIAPHHLEQPIGPDVLAALNQSTGLSFHGRSCFLGSPETCRRPLTATRRMTEFRPSKVAVPPRSGPA